MSKISLAPDASGTGIFTIASPGTSTNRTLTLPDATGTVVISGTTPSLNGITFPATQVPSADANTLDDYEEGTFTPAITFATPGTLSVSYTSRDGRYTKIGRIVYVQIIIIVSAFTKGTASGSFRISGLPFAGSSANDQMLVWSVYDTPITTTAGVFPMCAAENGETFLRLYEQSNNNTTNGPWPDPDAGSQYKFSGCYQTS
jgi:hypothetical protein